MRKPILAALAAAMLASCGSGEKGGETAASVPDAAPTAPALTDAQRATALAALPAPYDQADLTHGAQVFARCKSCHSLAEGGPRSTGPTLHRVVGRTAGTEAGYTYSRPLKEAGFEWDNARLDGWLTSPRTFLPGNKMNFPGLQKPEDRRDVIAYLNVEAAQ